MSEMKIGISGSIGSGKSTVARYIRDKGYFVFDCDAYNAWLLEFGNEGFNRVWDYIPEAFIGTYLSKQKLSQIIFNDPDKKALLESLLHPLIIGEMKRLSLEHDPYFAEVPLLFECGLEDLFDLTVLVVCDEEKALNRLKERGISEEDALRRLRSQMPVEDKMIRADEIIYNNGELEDLYREIDRILEEYVG